MRKRKINWFKFRIFLICLAIFLCFVLIGVRIFQFQVIRKEQLYKLASEQHYIKIPIGQKRGVIYDSKGNELAVSIEVDSIYANPRKIKQEYEMIKKLSSILQIEPKVLISKIRSRKTFEWIKRKVSPKEAEEVKALNIPGIYFIKESKRFYPNMELGAHVIGFVGLDSRGLEGVEFQYDKILSGKNEIWPFVRDARGRIIALDSPPIEKDNQPGNIYLTIDKYIQHVIETELTNAIKKWGAKGGLSIAMDPFTGRILAMASYPTFNPNEFLQYRSKSWRNRAISEVFEPGSLFKTFIAAAALEERLVNTGDSFFCENGVYNIHDRKIRDHSKYGWLTFQQIIKYSSNIGISKVAEKMGKERIYRYITLFGFGEKTKIGLPGEEKGIVHHPRYWSPVSLGTISFGQGISVTGIQLITALSAIANGGKLMRPIIIDRIENDNKKVLQSFEPEVQRIVISEETARRTTGLLKSVTEKGGTGEEASSAGYEVAGKTSTAQKIDTIFGGYSEDRYVSGFMGFSPLDKPKIALLVIIDEPKGSYYGGMVAAPVFRAVMEKILPYLGAFPKGSLIVKNELIKSEQEVMMVKNPNSNQNSINGVKMGKGAEVIMMPDLTGLSMRNALSRIEGKGLIIKVSGNGRLVEQIPKPGTILEKGDICYLKFEPFSSS